jgi:EmrB/QacA subfamily drug resistance transporter
MAANTITSGRNHTLLDLDARAKTVVMGAILLTLFLSALDQTIVGTALPRIVTDLNGASLYTWVVTAYLLASTITVPIYGKLSDVFGRKWPLMAGVSLFLAGSLLSGLAQNMNELVAARALQGLGAGATFPISLAVIGDLFSPRERGKYQGLFGAVFGLSFLVGPYTGGWITDNISWHWVFFVNLPLGLLALTVLFAALPSVGGHRASVRDLDFLGIVLFSAAMVPLLLGLTNKGEPDAQGVLPNWTDIKVGGEMLLGAALLGVFLIVERYAQHPIIDLRMFRQRDFSISMAAGFMFGIAMFGAVIFLPRFYQTVRGTSASASGYYIWPLLLGLIGSSITSGQIISRSGRYKWLMVVAAAVLITGAVLMTHVQANTPDWQLWVWMLVFGMGIGPSLAALTVIIQNTVKPEQLGIGTGTLVFMRQVGGSVGLAVAGTIFATRFVQQLPGSLAAAGVPDAVAKVVVSQSGGRLQGVGDLLPTLQKTLPPNLQALAPAIVQGIHNAFALAVGNLFWVSALAGGLALLGLLFLHDRPLRHREAVPLET